MALSLGGFELLVPLGRGGMGEVWRAVHHDSGVPAAVKVLTAARSRSEHALEAFRTEVRAVASLHHPGVVMVLDHGRVDPEAAEQSEGALAADSPWLAMELASGGALHPMQPMHWPELRALLISLLAALGHAHARGLVHRDLKPGNVLLCTEDDQRPGIKLTDFGIAFVAHGAGEPTLGGGTPGYMSPEQLRGESFELGPWTDLYALGCLAWQVATGDRLYPGKHGPALAMAQIAIEPGPFRPRMGVPRRFEGWLRTLLRKDPRSRYQCAADAAWALPDAGDAGAPPARALGAPVEEHPTVQVRQSVKVPLSDLEGPRRYPALLPPPPAAPVPGTWRYPRPSPPPAPLVGAGLGLFGLRDWPLVGREEARDTLWEALREAASLRQPRVVRIGGPSGVGKSALALWLARRAAEVGAATVIEVTHVGPEDAGEGSRRLIRAALRHRESLAPAETIQLVASHLGREDRAEEALLFDIMSGRPLAPEAMRSALTRVVERLGRQRAVLVRIDEAQYGADALAWLCTLLDEGPVDVPLLAVVTVRDEQLPERPEEAGLVRSLEDRPHVRRIALDPLDPAEQEQLLASTLGLDEGLVAVVVERTAGNPQFAVQLLSDWVRRGLLVPGPTGFVLQAGASADLPDDLYVVWSRHARGATDELSEAAQLCLERAAALGTEVDERDWEAVCGELEGEAALRAELRDRLLDRRLALPTERGFRFVHELLREAILRQARDAGRLTAHHRVCARWLDARAGDDPTLLVRLGRHLVACGEPLAAVQPMLKAADALRSSRSRESLAVLASAEQALRDAGVAQDDVLWFDLWWSRERTNKFLGNDRAALADSDRALGLARRKGWRRRLADALCTRAWLGMVTADLVDPEERIAEARAICDEIDHPGGVADILLLEHELAYLSRDYDRALDVIGRYRAFVGERGNREGVVRADLDRGNLHILRGELAEAHHYATRAQADFAELGHTDGESVAWNSLGEVSRLEGDLDEAERCYRHALEMMVRTGSAEAATMRINLGLVLLATRRFAEAREMLVRAIAARSVRTRPTRALACHVALAAVMAASGDWVDVDRHLARAEALLRPEHAVDQDYATCLELAGALSAEAGKLARARHAWSLAHNQYRRLGRDADAERVARALRGTG